MENNNFDIFNLPTEAFITPPKTGTTEIYSPSADKGREGVYKALIRFLPNVNDPKKSKLMKYYVWLEDPANGNGFSVDCPSTVGKKSVLKDLYWKLKKSESVKDQELADKYFSRVESHYSLVQILKDPNQPELEGKIMVFKYGAKINQKIEAQLKPEFGNPCNPFDLFAGKVFALHIVKKMKWNNYDACEFVGEAGPLLLDGKAIQRNHEDMERVSQWLKTNSPDLSKYEYKEWDEEIERKVMSTISKIVPDGRIVEQISSSAKNEGAAKSNANASGKPDTSFSNDNFFTETNSAKEDSAPASTGKSISNLDDLYNDL